MPRIQHAITYSPPGIVSVRVPKVAHVSSHMPRQASRHHRHSASAGGGRFSGENQPRHAEILSETAAAEVESKDWMGHRAVSLPGLTVTVSEMAEALKDKCGEEVAARIKWEVRGRG